jgi:hypothetical protein
MKRNGIEALAAIVADQTASADRTSIKQSSCVFDLIDETWKIRGHTLEGSIGCQAGRHCRSRRTPQGPSSAMIDHVGRDL